MPLQYRWTIIIPWAIDNNISAGALPTPAQQRQLEAMDPQPWTPFAEDETSSERQDQRRRFHERLLQNLLAGVMSILIREVEVGGVVYAEWDQCTADEGFLSDVTSDLAFIKKCKKYAGVSTRSRPIKRLPPGETRLTSENFASLGDYGGDEGDDKANLPGVQGEPEKSVDDEVGDHTPGEAEQGIHAKVGDGGYGEAGKTRPKDKAPAESTSLPSTPALAATAPPTGKTPAQRNGMDASPTPALAPTNPPTVPALSKTSTSAHQPQHSPRPTAGAKNTTSTPSAAPTGPPQYPAPPTVSASVRALQPADPRLSDPSAFASALANTVSQPRAPPDARQSSYEMPPPTSLRRGSVDDQLSRLSLEATVHPCRNGCTCPRRPPAVSRDAGKRDAGKGDTAGSQLAANGVPPPPLASSSRNSGGRDRTTSHRNSGPTKAERNGARQSLATFEKQIPNRGRALDQQPYAGRRAAQQPHAGRTLDQRSHTARAPDRRIGTTTSPQGLAELTTLDQTFQEAMRLVQSIRRDVLAGASREAAMDAMMLLETHFIGAHLVEAARQDEHRVKAEKETQEEG